MAIQRNPFGNEPKAIYQMKNGKTIQKFKSISDAVVEIKKLNPNANCSNISSCANNKIKSAYGFVWKFAE